MRSATVGRGPEAGRRLRARRRAGITLTEILISIMILGIGLISLATLFPLGLLRLRTAARWSRSATLLETAACDILARGLFNSQSFVYVDELNYQFGLSKWYISPSDPVLVTGQYDPLVYDTPYYGGSVYTTQGQANQMSGLDTKVFHGPGIMFAYDPLWRYQTTDPRTATQGYYLNPASPNVSFEARFGYGLPTLPATDNDGNGIPSAHGLPRITNFNRPHAAVRTTVNNRPVTQTLPIMPSAYYVPNIFVSQEDVVWQESDTTVGTYNIAGSSANAAIDAPSPILPDLNTAVQQGSSGVTIDWRYSWMFTGQASNANNLSAFDGNIVIFENRPFGISTPGNLPTTPAGNYASQKYQVEGELVVEGIFGHSGNIISASGPAAKGNNNAGPGYGTGANRTVLLRWSRSMEDPVVRPGNWIADVTYERQGQTVLSRFYPGGAGFMNWTNKGEWDNLPAQRCFWYQVQKATEPVSDPYLGAGYRSMVVYVNQDLQARTVLSAPGKATFMNAALIAPNVVNVIPQTIFLR